MKKKLTLTDVRYYYGILRNFNKYFASSVPYINNQLGVEVPGSTLSLGIQSYMSKVRELCQLNVKTDLRFLILEKTAENV